MLSSNILTILYIYLGIVATAWVLVLTACLSAIILMPIVEATSRITNITVAATSRLFRKG